MSRSKVLVVEDEEDLARLVQSYLDNAGFEVKVVKDGALVLDAVRDIVPEVVVLDVMLPNVDGLTLCREIRKTENVPILMMSARGEDLDKILGLELGADDYIVKPVNPKEIVARVRAMVRRSQMINDPRNQGAALLTCHGLKLDLNAQQAELDGQALALTPIEFALLRTMLTQKGSVLSRRELLSRVWGDDFQGDERTVDVHIGRLRGKLQKVSDLQFIRSVWGVGYRLEE